MRTPIGVRDEWGYEGHRGRCRTDVKVLRFGSAYLEKVTLLCEHLSPSLGNFEESGGRTCRRPMSFVCAGRVWFTGNSLLGVIGKSEVDYYY